MLSLSNDFPEDTLLTNEGDLVFALRHVENNDAFKLYGMNDLEPTFFGGVAKEGLGWSIASFDEVILEETSHVVGYFFFERNKELWAVVKSVNEPSKMYIVNDPHSKLIPVKTDAKSISINQLFSESLVFEDIKRQGGPRAEDTENANSHHPQTQALFEFQQEHLGRILRQREQSESNQEVTTMDIIKNVSN